MHKVSFDLLRILIKIKKEFKKKYMVQSEAIFLILS